VHSLIENMSKFQDWDNPMYSNIMTFKELDSGLQVHQMAGAA
jgi:hypothetical protein